MIRDVQRVYLRDVAGDFLLAIVGPVGDLGVFIPFAGVDALAADCLEASPETSDPCKEIDETKGPLPVQALPPNLFGQILDDKRRGLGFA